MWPPFRIGRPSPIRRLVRIDRRARPAQHARMNGRERAARSTSTGPSTPFRAGLQRIVQDRSVRLAAGLAIAVTIPVAILFYFEFRSLNALEDTSGVVL